MSDRVLLFEGECDDGLFEHGTHLFIGHEFIIYLLKNALREEDAFRSFATWPLTEALAEYYLKRIMGNTCFFDGQRQWRMFYEQQDQELTAVQLYRLALQEQIRS